MKGLFFGNFSGPTITLSGGSNHTISGNIFGGSNGSFVHPNATAVSVGSNTSTSLIGGDFDLASGDFNPADMNVIINTTATGVDIEGASSVQVSGNLLGVGQDGTSSDPNAIGIEVNGSLSSILFVTIKFLTTQLRECS